MKRYRTTTSGRQLGSSIANCSPSRGRAGFLAIDVPEEYGGGGVKDFRYSVIIAEELQKAGVNSIGLGLTLHNDICIPYFLHQTNEEQRARWLPGICRGEQITASP
ncbi:MAG: acyl-CoA dehydrogenase family protein [Ilumatobacteraceae bacterium]